LVSGADLGMSIGLESHFYHSPEGAAFADVRVNGHRETWPQEKEWSCQGFPSRVRRCLAPVLAQNALLGPQET
jgi:hypothetical protein